MIKKKKRKIFIIVCCQNSIFYRCAVRRQKPSVNYKKSNPKHGVQQYEPIPYLAKESAVADTVTSLKH